MWGLIRGCGLILVLGLVVGCSDDASVIEGTRAKSSERVATSRLPSPGDGAVQMDPILGDEEATDSTTIEKAGPADTVYRPMDDRVRHDDEALAKVGIHAVSSRRLILYSDLPREEITHLPSLVDQLFDVWVAYFGELPPDRLGKDWQITGYLMADEDLFRRAGLLIEHLPHIDHGIHRGRRFWMRDQGYDYYQAHLLLHEATHCFMTTLPDSMGPVWYMEGMAEYFALHRTEPSGATKFGIRPPEPEQILGFDRIDVIRGDIREDRARSLNEIAGLTSSEFRDKSDYAWAWALCWFLNHHPRYQERFQSIAAPAFRPRFREEIERAFAAEQSLLPMEWAVFVHEIAPGFDFERMAIEFPSTVREVTNEPLETRIAANRGWQATGWRLRAGTRYCIAGEGRVVLDTVSRPWESYPDGISFDFARGNPLGLLQAAILEESAEGVSPESARALLSPFDVGEQAELTPERTGQLFLRINDHAHDLSNNQGEYRVTIQVEDAPY